MRTTRAEAARSVHELASAKEETGKFLVVVRKQCKAALGEVDKRRVPSSEELDGLDAAADAFCETRRKILSRAVEATAAAVKIDAASIV